MPSGDVIDRGVTLYFALTHFAPQVFDGNWLGETRGTPSPVPSVSDQSHSPHGVARSLDNPTHPSNNLNSQPSRRYCRSKVVTACGKPRTRQGPQLGPQSAPTVRNVPVDASVGRLHDSIQSGSFFCVYNPSPNPGGGAGGGGAFSADARGGDGRPLASTGAASCAPGPAASKQTSKQGGNTGTAAGRAAGAPRRDAAATHRPRGRSPRGFGARPWRDGAPPAASTAL